LIGDQKYYKPLLAKKPLGIGSLVAGSLCEQYLTLLSLQRYQELSKQRLDRAILVFVQSFRRSYVGDQAMHSSKVNKQLFSYFLF
jgi:hypothetical protein